MHCYPYATFVYRTQELVALSGAHTIGSKGFGGPTSFDNSYYKVLLEKPWASSGKLTAYPISKIALVILVNLLLV